MLDIPKDGLIVWLREFGQIKLLALPELPGSWSIFIHTLNT